MEKSPLVLPDKNSFKRLFMNTPECPLSDSGEDETSADALASVIGQLHERGSVHQGEDHHPGCPGAD